MTTADRMVERLVERREPPPPRYPTEPEWLPKLHDQLGVPWPCGEDEAFRTVWDGVLHRLEGLQVDVGEGTYAGWNDGDPTFARAAWCAVRHLSARTVVETGVARGLVSAVVLCAIDPAAGGRLYSIDLAPLTASVDQHEVGLAVAPELRSAWSYLPGSSRQRLPGLLRTIPPVDVFLHDSLHTTRNVRFELSRVQPALNRRAVLLIDDIHRNHAFLQAQSQFPGSFAVAHARGAGAFGVIVSR